MWSGESGQVDGARDEIDADPGVDPDARPGAPRASKRRQRIERCRLSGEIGGARLEVADVVGVAASAHLDQQGVEALRFRGADQRAMAAGEVNDERSTQRPRVSLPAPSATCAPMGDIGVTAKQRALNTSAAAARWSPRHARNDLNMKQPNVPARLKGVNAIDG